MITESITDIALDVIKSLIVKMILGRETCLSSDQVEGAIAERLRPIVSDIDALRANQTATLTHMHRLLKNDPGIQFNNSTITISPDFLNIQNGENNTVSVTTVRERVAQHLRRYVEASPAVEDAIIIEEEKAEESTAGSKRSSGVFARWKDAAKLERSRD